MAILFYMTNIVFSLLFILFLVYYFILEMNIKK